MSSFVGRVLATVAENIVRASGTFNFRGKGRLITHWLRLRQRDARRMRILPGGARIECHLAHDYDCMVFLRQEEETDLRAVGALLRPGEVFVDCGANIGLWTLAACAKVGPRGSVIAFEPNPPTFARLERNVRDINDFGTRARLVSSAVGAASGTATFSPDVNHNISRIRTSTDGGTLTVPVTTIDNELGGAPVAGMKLDVEGYELAVLLGAARAIARCRPWLCVEFNTVLVGNDLLGDWDVDRHLRSHGYLPILFSAANSANAKYLPLSWRARGYVNLLYRPTAAAERDEFQ